jgi:hypothetical protein
VATVTAVVSLAPHPHAYADPTLPAPGYFASDEDPWAEARKHLYIAGFPAKWPGPFIWRYNDSGRPGLLSKSDVIAGINAAANQWMNVCGVAIARASNAPDTTTPAQTINGTSPSPGENVIGWGDLSIGPGGSAITAGVTFAASFGSALADADVTFSTKWITNTTALHRVAVHELGHVIGLSHSNVENTVMSGPASSSNADVPPTSYNGLVDLQPDDVQGCLCLYGPGPITSGSGYICDLPKYRDFGTLPVGATSAAQSVTVRNAAASGNVTINGVAISNAEFQSNGGCAAGTTLGPGQSCTFGITWSPAGLDGARRAFVRILTGSPGPYAFPVIGTAAIPHTPNYQGLWWKAPAGSESGWGINFAHQGDTLFATWFTYDADGSTLWVVVAATKVGADAYSGTLYRATGPSFDAAPFDSAQVVGTAVGTATFTFTDGTNATFAYTIGGTTQTKNLTREAFASPVPTCAWGALTNLALATNYQDIWWNAPAGSESGWGLYINQQGDTIFATWFTYRTDGRPWWLAMTAVKTAANVYSGNLYTGSGPPFNGATFDPSAVVPIPVGTGTLAFADGNNATFTYIVNGVSQSKQITREVFTPPGTTCQ